MTGGSTENGGTSSELSGNAGESETFFLTLETGQLVALHARTLTVQDVWEAAEALSA